MRDCRRARWTEILCAVGLALAWACGRQSNDTLTPAQITRSEQTSGTSALLIAVSPVDERVVWVSGSQGTWLRTIDGGTTWQSGRVSGADTLQFRDVHAVDASTAYLLSIGDGPQSRIYKTTDAGQHWTLQFTNRDPGGFYDCMAFWDSNHGIVIGDAIGKEIAMLTTTDGGANWTRVPPASLPEAQPKEGSFAASGTCVVTRPGGRAWIVASSAARARVLRTADYGRTWVVDTLPDHSRWIRTAVDRIPRRSERDRARRRKRGKAVRCVGRGDKRRRAHMGCAD